MSLTPVKSSLDEISRRHGKVYNRTSVGGSQDSHKSASPPKTRIYLNATLTERDVGDQEQETQHLEKCGPWVVVTLKSINNQSIKLSYKPNASQSVFLMIEAQKLWKD